MKVFACRIFAAAVAVTALAAPTRADVVDRAFVQNAADIASAIRKLNAEYVAVLKFEVTVGNQPPSFNAGLANTQLAQKLENLLVLTYDPNNGSPVVLTGAAAKAAALPPGTTWKDPAGRKQLAGIKGLPIAWDKTQSLTPEAFVTGELLVSADLRSASVVIRGFTRQNPAELKELYTTPEKAAGEERPAVPADRSLLSMVGATFSVVDRSLDRSEGDREALKQALAGLTQPTAFAQRMTLSPVKLEVLLNGEPVQPETDPANPAAGRIGRAPGSDPKKGDEIQFRLKNMSKARAYAVLLAVNGKNTNALSNDHLNGRPPKDHRLWVLRPDETIIVEGFYTTPGGALQPFKILGESESAAVYPLMGDEYRGLITMHVFGERTEVAATPKSNPNPPKPSGEPTAEDPAKTVKVEAEVTLLSLGVGGDALEEVRVAGNSELAQQKLQNLTNVRPAENGRLGLDPLKETALERGLIVPSETRKGGGPIETVDFKLDPNYLSFVQLRYYGR